MKEKKIYSDPEMNIITFKIGDVITTSGIGGNTIDGEVTSAIMTEEDAAFAVDDVELPS